MLGLVDRLFRMFGTLRLWHQFALLGLFSTVVPIYLTSALLLQDGRRILEEHEIIDLADESNLRIVEMREEFDYLTQDLGKIGRELNHVAPAELKFQSRQKLEALQQRWNDASLKPGDDAKNAAQLRGQFFAGSLLRFDLVKLKREERAGQEDRVTAQEYLLNEPPGTELEALVGQACERLSRERSLPTYCSSLKLVSIGGKRRCCAVIARAAKWENREPTHAAIMVVDFTSVMRNRRSTSPRHQYLIFGPDETILIHPKDDLVGTKLTATTPWNYPEEAQAKPGETDEARGLRIAKLIRNGGARIETDQSKLGADEQPITNENLRGYYRKGYFGGGSGEALLTALKSTADIDVLNRSLADYAKTKPTGADLRFGIVEERSKYIEVAHRNRDTLLEVCAIIDQWWAESRKPKRAATQWIDPLECKSFQGQLVYLRLDTNDEDEPARLIVASSLEELSEDIKTQFERLILTRVLPIAAGAGLLSILLIVMFTYSLRRLARTADKLADLNAEAKIEGGGSVEVTQLARSMDKMVTKLRDDAVRVQAILRSAGEGIVVANSDGVIEEANRAASRMFGYAQGEDLVGMKIRTLLADDPDTIDGASQLLDSRSSNTELSSARVQSAVRGRRKDGSFFWLELTMRPVELRNRIAITGIFRDVTQKKAAEDEIQRMNEGLEQRVRLRTAELAEANVKLIGAVERAEDAARAKDTFVANMSHELRQPLHTITGYTELLKEEAEDTGRGELVPDLNKILAAAKHLLGLINDILDLAKISAGKMELQLGEFLLTRVVDDVKTLVAPLADKNRNRFVVDAHADLGTMIADELRLRQILINLLSNSFKFTDDGIVTLHVRRITNAGRAMIEFAVSDTGYGMTADQVARLFERFYQADDATTRKQGGTGLGLAITRSFIELMGGDPIEVTSLPGKGSHFIVRLPAVVVAPDSTKPMLRPGSISATEDARTDVHGIVGEHRGTVLVIDDDVNVQELMTRFLNKEGFEVVAARTGPDGIRMATELHPAAITLDVMMPDTDGWNVLTQLKENPKTCDIPVVMLTIVDDRGRGFALGAADYLTKPIDWPRLSSVLKRYQTGDRQAPVLVVDDDAESRAMVRRFLELDGRTVMEAANGADGLAKIASRMPALVLLDLLMPVLDGFGFLTELAVRFPGAKIPVIVLTAKDLTSEDYHQLNGRVHRILEKGDLARFENLAAFVRQAAHDALKETRTP